MVGSEESNPRTGRTAAPFDGDRRIDDPDLPLVSDPDLEHVLECVFGIQPHEVRTYFELIEAPGATVTELEDLLDRDRSTVNRALLALQEKGFVTRERRMLESGGYVYQYTAIPLDEARQNLHAALDRWTDTVHAELERLRVDRFDNIDIR